MTDVATDGSGQSRIAFDRALTQAKQFLVTRYTSTESDGFVFGELADALEPRISNQVLLKVVDVLQAAGLVRELDVLAAFGLSPQEQWELGFAGPITTEQLRDRMFTIQPAVVQDSEESESETDPQVGWLHEAGSEPPIEYYRDKWLTGTMTEMGFAIRSETLDSVTTDRAHSNYLKRAASGKVPRIWCRDTLTDDIEVFLRHREPRDVDAVLKELHACEARLLKFPTRKSAEVNGTQGK